jgi:hypothetical protein
MAILQTIATWFFQFIVEWGWKKWRKSQEIAAKDADIEKHTQAAAEAMENAKTQEELDQADRDILNGI